MPAPLTDALLDPSSHETAFDWDAAEAEFAQREAWAKTAKLYDFIHRAMSRAARFPEIFVNTAAMSQREIDDFARRSALLDLASRLRASEVTIAARFNTASVMKQRLPILWTHFSDGEVSEFQVREAARGAEDLPPAVWAQFDQAVSAARDLTNPKFKKKVRTLRERLHPESMTERHIRAMDRRELRIEHEADGMSWLGIYDSSDRIALAQAHVDKVAFEQFKDPNESRTMAQLRADVATQLLTGELTGSGAKVSVALTVPVLSLLGHSDEPATLEGVGPIDIATARDYVGGADSFIRILTDPIKCTVLDIDRTKYKVPEAMKRWLQQRDQTCTAPGCNRRAVYCDLDHTVQFGAGQYGKTAVKNLAHLCRHHHRVKHNSKWKVEQADDGTVRWISPTGHLAETDPPPF